IVDSVANGSYSCPDGDSSAQTITCSAPHLDSGQTKSITVTYHVASSKATEHTVIAGNELTFTITATNIGPSDAQGVHVDDTLDSHLNAPVYCLGSGCTPVIPWTGTVALGTLTAGASIDVVIKATVDPGTPQSYVISNTATIGSATDDPNPGNNTSSTTTTVDTEADLSVSKTAPATATAGDP